MAITMDALLAALPAAEYDIFKASQTSEGAGTFHSLWKAAGRPAAGATPPAFGSGSGYVPTRATVGAIGQANPVGNRYLANVNLSASVVGSLIIYDRLWTCSGFGTVVTTAQNVVSGGSLPAGRTPNGAADVELWLEVYTAPGATGATWKAVARRACSCDIFRSARRRSEISRTKVRMNCSPPRRMISADRLMSINWPSRRRHCVR